MIVWLLVTGGKVRPRKEAVNLVAEREIGGVITLGKGKNLEEVAANILTEKEVEGEMKRVAANLVAEREIGAGINLRKVATNLLTEREVEAVKNPWKVLAANLVAAREIGRLRGIHPGKVAART